jgi:hypothetical protein
MKLFSTEAHKKHIVQKISKQKVLKTLGVLVTKGCFSKKKLSNNKNAFCCCFLNEACL